MQKNGKEIADEAMKPPFWENLILISGFKITKLYYFNRTKWLYVHYYRVSLKRFTAYTWDVRYYRAILA